MSAPTWTPAPKPGLIPLHPLSFGTILGKAFAALRHNPKVLFGFAVVVQLLVTLVTAGAMVLLMLWTFGRLETLRPGSDEYLTVAIGSAASAVVAGVLIGLGTTAFAAIVQGVVAADVAEAALGSKPTLGELWRRVRPAAWRLIGYTLLLGLVAATSIVLILGIIFGGIGALTGFRDAGMGLAVIVTALVALGLVPLYVWLGTKLLLVPSILVLERDTLRGSVVRSWRLIRGRFWVAFGVIFLIGLIMGTAAQVVSFPATLLSSVIMPVIAPTGNMDAAAIGGIVLSMALPQVLITVIQAISSVVQSTGATLVYVDARMRHEGIDQDLMAAVERRQAGLPLERDPFAVDPARAVTATYQPLQKTAWDVPPAPPAYPAGQYPAPGYPALGYGPQGYGTQGYGAPGYPAPGHQQPYGYPVQGQPDPAQQAYGQPADGQPAPPPPAPPAAPLPPASQSPWAPPAEERGWTAPGSSDSDWSGADRG